MGIVLVYEGNPHYIVMSAICYRTPQKDQLIFITVFLSFSLMFICEIVIRNP